jgi:hypothetical protein
MASFEVDLDCQPTKGLEQQRNARIARMQQHDAARLSCTRTCASTAMLHALLPPCSHRWQPCTCHCRLCRLQCASSAPSALHSTCRLDGPQYTESRAALRAAAEERHRLRGEHDSTGAVVVRRFAHVPQPASHDPYKDVFKSRTFGETGHWTC